MEKKKQNLNLKLTNILILGSVFSFFLIFYIMILKGKLEKHSITEFEWMIGNPDLGFSTPIGTLSILCLISGIISLIIYVYLAHYLYNLKKEKERVKENSSLANLLKNTAIFLSLGRFVELFRIGIYSEFYAIRIGLFRYFVLFDILSAIFFFSFLIDVFLSDFPKERERTEKKFFIISNFSIFAGLLPIFEHFNREVNDAGQTTFNYAFSIIAIISFSSFLYIVVQITFKIIRLKNRIEENKAAFNAMIVQAILFSVVMLFSSIIIGFPSLTFAFVLRVIKNILLMVIAALFFPAFITPALKKKK